MTDTVADLITRVKNGYLARKDEVRTPSSRLRVEIARLLVETGYAASYEVVEQAPQNELVITLRYVGKLPSLTNVRRISKPGRRLYSTIDTLPKVLGGYGTAVLSTSKGLLTVQQAKAQGVGGEVLFTLW